MENFVDFASGKTGRLLRIIVGTALLIYAIISATETLQIVLSVFGVVLIASGVLKVCLFNKLVGRPLNACPVEK